MTTEQHSSHRSLLTFEELEAHFAEHGPKWKREQRELADHIMLLLKKQAERTWDFVWHQLP